MRSVLKKYLIFLPLLFAIQFSLVALLPGTIGLFPTNIVWLEILKEGLILVGPFVAVIALRVWIVKGKMNILIGLVVLLVIFYAGLSAELLKERVIVNEILETGRETYGHVHEFESFFREGKTESGLKVTFEFEMCDSLIITRPYTIERGDYHYGDSVKIQYLQSNCRNIVLQLYQR